MKKTRILVAVSGVFLVAILVLLVSKTRSVDFETHNEVVEILRALRQLDAEWNVDVHKSKTGFNSSYDPIATPLPLIGALEHGLVEKSGALWGLKSESLLRLQPLIDAYRSAMQEKIAMIERFKSQNAILRNSSRFVPKAAADLISTIRAQSANTIDRPVMEEHVNSLLSGALSYALNADSELKATLYERIEVLMSLSERSPSEVRDLASMFVSHASTVLRQQEIGNRILNDIAAMPTARKIDELNDATSTEYARLQVAQQSYRIALIAYSISILLLLGYFGWRLAQSYRLLARTNQELQESQAHLVQSEKMSALGQMVAGIAHEINTPLAYVKGTLEVLVEQLGEIREVVTRNVRLTDLIRQNTGSPEAMRLRSESIAKLVKEIDGSGGVDELQALVKEGVHGIDQISEIVVNLKNFSRLDRARMGECSVVDGLESTLLLARNLLGNTISVKKEFNSVPKISCSPSQINQVFLNLITNAIQAMPEGSSGPRVVTLRTAVDNDQMVRIEVQDNGPGIPPDVLPKIFDPFFTTKEVGKGTGMGLAISYKIIQEHGGKILVHSEPGMGTLFTILLPVAQKKPAASKAGELLLAA